MTEPLVSIILPTYNRAGLISNAIESVLAQAFKNWELIIWIDGATDNTEEIVNSYNDKRIKIYKDENHGMSYALNCAIKTTESEYIAFLDDDDRWLNKKLLTQIKVLENHPGIDMIFGDFLNIDKENGKESLGFTQNSHILEELKYVKVDENAFLITENLLLCLAKNNFIAFDTVVIRKTTIEKVGIFNERLRNGQDFEYWWRLGLIKGQFAFSTETLMIRNKYPHSLSSTSIETLNNRLTSLDSCLNLALESNRRDLMPILSRPYRNTWQNLITAYSGVKNTKMIFKSFFKSLYYGLNLGSFRLLFNALLKVINHNIN